MIMNGEVEFGGGNNVAGAPIPTPLMADSNRAEQMATIRQLLSKVKNDVDKEPKAEVDERPAAAAPRAPIRRRDDDIESGDKSMS